MIIRKLAGQKVIVVCGSEANEGLDPEAIIIWIKNPAKKPLSYPRFNEEWERALVKLILGCIESALKLAEFFTI